MDNILESAKKSFFKLYKKGALHIFTGNFATKFIAFFGSIVVVRLLTKEEYGVLSYMENIYGYAYLFTGFGATYALLRYIVLGKNVNEKRHIYKYFILRSAKIDVIILCVVCLAILIYKHPEEYASFKLLLVLSMIALPFNDLLDESLSTMRALFRNKQYAYFSLCVSIVLIGGRVLGAVVCKLRGVVFSKIIIYIMMSIVITVYLLKKDLNIKNSSMIPINYKKKEMNSYGLQYMITNGFWAFYMLNDTFLLGILGNGAQELAEYKVAYVLPGNVSIVSAAIGTFVAPFFVLNAKKKQWIRDNFKKCYLITAALVGCLVVVMYILARPLIMLLYGEEYLTVLPIMRMLLIAAFINCGLRYTTANILAAMGDIKYNMIISLLGIVLQLMINYKLIPRFGSMGVAYTSIICYTTMAFALFWIFYKKYMCINNE